MFHRPLRSTGTGLAVAVALAAAGLLGTGSAAQASDGLAHRPPMGWNSWNTFGCNINSELVRGMADSIVNSGMRDAGYEYVVIDDCWFDPVRDQNGNLRANAARFPEGIKALADYVHGKGLKFGIYQVPTDKTCAQRGGGYPGSTGSRGFERQDARQFAAWGVDFLKYDWCSPEGTLEDQIAAFTLMRDELRATGRSIVYSINPNSYHSKTGAAYDWGSIANMWRTTEDIAALWDNGEGSRNTYPMGVSNIIQVNGALPAQTRPGHWNDPDMLEVGVGTRLTATENRSHMSMWAMMASPLIAGNDIRSQTSATKDILTAPEVIAVNQDPLGRQGVKVADSGGLQVWSKTLTGTGRRAVALFNTTGSTADIRATWSDLGLNAGNASVRDLWARADLGSFTGGITRSVPSHGVVLLEVGGTEGGARVPTAKTDSRTITDLTVSVSFTVNGTRHQDGEYVGTLDKRTVLALDGVGGLASGGVQRGNFLYGRGSIPGTAGFDIQKLDTRAIDNLSISVTFRVNGQAHYDYETVGNLTGTIRPLQLNAQGGKWDGSRWVGDFLRGA